MQSNFSSKFFITSTGIAEPPEMQERRLDMSASSAPSACSMPAYMVGTPSKMVTSSRATIVRALSGSKRGSRVRQDPLSTDALSPQVRPKTWKRGRHPITTSFSESSTNVSAVVAAFVLMP